MKSHVIDRCVERGLGLTYPVLGCKLFQTPLEIAIVHHIMVTECCPFRSASRTTGIHDADGVIELLLTLPLCQLLVAHLVAQLQQIAPSIHAGPPIVPKSNDGRQLRKARRFYY